MTAFVGYCSYCWIAINILHSEFCSAVICMLQNRTSPEIADSRWRSGATERSGRGGRGNYASRYAAYGKLKAIIALVNAVHYLHLQFRHNFILMIIFFFVG